MNGSSLFSLPDQQYNSSSGNSFTTTIDGHISIQVVANLTKEFSLKRFCRGNSLDDRSILTVEYLPSVLCDQSPNLILKFLISYFRLKENELWVIPKIDGNKKTTYEISKEFSIELDPNYFYVANSHKFRPFYPFHDSACEKRDIKISWNDAFKKCYSESKFTQITHEKKPTWKKLGKTVEVTSNHTFMNLTIDVFPKNCTPKDPIHIPRIHVLKFNGTDSNEILYKPMKRLLSLESIGRTKILREKLDSWITGQNETLYQPDPYLLGKDKALALRFSFNIENLGYSHGLSILDGFDASSSQCFDKCFSDSNTLEFWMNDEWEECFETTTHFEYRP
uniref:Uncharacterized protein n=1 Tax=Acrobeloides nanus TaxID=290746 RepID=A0A914D736_9BILA